MSTTEIDVYTPGTARASLPAKVQYAKLLADSGLLPSAYRKQPANVLYAVEYGDMLGLSPMAAITGIHIIEGKPTASAALISALVRRAGHRLRVTGNDERAVAEIVRSDDPDFVFRSEWTLERAVQAGLCTLKNGRPWARDGKGNPKPWEKFTAAMLKARAVTEVARDACEEALSGVHYTPEELGAEVDEEGNVVGEIVPDGAVAQQDPAPRTTAPAADPGEMWNVHPAPDEPDPHADLIAEMGTFTTDDRGRELWAQTVKWWKQDKSIDGAEAARLQGLIKARWKELKDAAEAEPVDGEIVEPLDPADPWAARVEEIASPDDAQAVASEVADALSSGELNDAKAASVYAAISAREQAVRGAAA